jgi:hypothetical protein
VSRIINTAGSPTTQRNRLRRSIAESLRRLMEKPRFDQESKDLTAFIVFALREIAEGVNQSAEAWEKRDYYIKADRFRQEWEWLGPMERLLTTALVYEQWNDLPPLFARLLAQFQDVTINKMTRSERLWDGAYDRLMAEQAPTRGKL